MVEQAQKDGMTVVIMAPGGAKDAANKPKTRMEDMTSMGIKFRTEVRRLLTHAPQIPYRIVSALEVASPDGTL
ncbi:MAG TPA: hypothetical protein VLQ68_12605, partial [Rhizobiaceae bacterium]|nr:hypothetical protein [Rhizobiaceae bacterium]